MNIYSNSDDETDSAIIEPHLSYDEVSVLAYKVSVLAYTVSVLAYKVSALPY